MKDSARSELLLTLNERQIEYRSNVSAKALTTFKVGGNIDTCIMPKTKEELIFSAIAAKHIGESFMVLGRGSNTVFSDEGYDGTVILTDRLRNTNVERRTDGDLLIAECGVPLTALSAFASKLSLSGLEFAYGIPGSCGGAVFMNAGAYGGQMSDIVEASECLDLDTDTLLVLDKEKHGFDYRKSTYSDSNGKLIALSVKMQLKYGDRDEIEKTMQLNMLARKEKQPLEFPSAGSVFKRHPGFYMGQIIEESGLKGFRVGGAEVSEKHAGFIVNRGGATASDIRLLVEHIRCVIYDRYGFVPECEIRFIDQTKSR